MQDVPPPPPLPPCFCCFCRLQKFRSAPLFSSSSSKEDSRGDKACLPARAAISGRFCLRLPSRTTSASLGLTLLAPAIRLRLRLCCCSSATGSNFLTGNLRGIKIGEDGGVYLTTTGPSPGERGLSSSLTYKRPCDLNCSSLTSSVADLASEIIESMSIEDTLEGVQTLVLASHRSSRSCPHVGQTVPPSLLNGPLPQL